MTTVETMVTFVRPKRIRYQGSVLRVSSFDLHVRRFMGKVVCPSLPLATAALPPGSRVGSGDLLPAVPVPGLCLRFLIAPWPAAQTPGCFPLTCRARASAVYPRAGGRGASAQGVESFHFASRESSRSLSHSLFCRVGSAELVRCKGLGLS